MNNNRGRLLGLLLGLSLLGLSGCELGTYDHYPSAYYRERIYYPDGSRYLAPRRAYVAPRREVIIRPDGRREWVYER